MGQDIGHIAPKTIRTTAAVQGQVAPIRFSFDFRILEVHKGVNFRGAELDRSCISSTIF